MRRPVLAIAMLVIGLLCAGSPATATTFPERIPLPDGFYPEGIEVGTGHDFYVGSLLDGAVYKGDLRTGEGAVLAAGVADRFLAGLEYDDRSGLLWAVGGDEDGTKLFAFDGASGDLIHEIDIDGAFINDLVVTRDALYITDSLADQLWSVPLTNRGAPAGPPRAISLDGDFRFVDVGELPINLNGIDATANGRTLIAVHSTLGVLYRIDPVTGEATEIDLGGATVPFGDGIVLHGRTLYVVQNFLNTVAVVKLQPDLASGEVVDTITSDLFRVPATAARFGNRVYVVNARFDVAPPPFLGDPIVSVDYDVVRVPRH
ncbi:MAG: superoxide dismutase [Actinobacteria bacterium]|nr:superoxide dismutase [Actinomycetota bacterium]